MDTRKKFKLQGIFNTILGVILVLTIIYSFTGHLINHKNYIDALPEEKKTGESLSVIGVVLITIIGDIALAVATFLNFLSGVRLINAEKSGKPAVIFGIISQLLTSVGFIFFFSSCYNSLSIVVFGVVAALTFAVVVHGVYLCFTAKRE